MIHCQKNTSVIEKLYTYMNAKENQIKSNQIKSNQIIGDNGYSRTYGVDEKQIQFF